MKDGSNRISFTPISGKRAFEAVSEQIKEQIIRGVLRPGDRLPPEAELARQFQVGRQTVREALRILELAGIIAIQSGYRGGPIVKNTIASKVTGLLQDALQLEDISAAELTQARLILEKETIRQVIELASSKELAALQKNIDLAREHIHQGKMATRTNFDFHTLLAKSAKNRVFEILMGAVNAIMRILRDRTAIDLAISAAAVEAHQNILDAVKERNSQKALKLLEDHILDVSRSFD